MTLYALAESRVVMKFYEALRTGKKSRIYEAYIAYKDIIEITRRESLRQEEKIDSEYRKWFK